MLENEDIIKAFKKKYKIKNKNRVIHKNILTESKNYTKILKYPNSKEKYNKSNSSNKEKKLKSS